MRVVRTGPQRPGRTLSSCAGAVAFAIGAAGTTSPAIAAPNAAVPLTIAGAKGVSEFYKSRD